MPGIQQNLGNHEKFWGFSVAGVGVFCCRRGERRGFERCDPRTGGDPRTGCRSGGDPRPRLRPGVAVPDPGRSGGHPRLGPAAWGCRRGERRGFERCDPRTGGDPRTGCRSGGDPRPRLRPGVAVPDPGRSGGHPRLGPAAWGCRAHRNEFCKLICLGCWNFWVGLLEFWVAGIFGLGCWNLGWVAGIFFCLVALFGCCENVWLL
uniref:Uncharacterized protein n=1 Tax=Fagus sylvatica TaxID=28930 RepID=A0A2N9GW60_FAGSY